MSHPRGRQNARVDKKNDGELKLYARKDGTTDTFLHLAFQPRIKLFNDAIQDYVCESSDNVPIPEIVVGWNTPTNAISVLRIHTSLLHVFAKSISSQPHKVTQHDREDTMIRLVPDTVWSEQMKTWELVNILPPDMTSHGKVLLAYFSKGHQVLLGVDLIGPWFASADEEDGHDDNVTDDE